MSHAGSHVYHRSMRDISVERRASVSGRLRLNLLLTLMLASSDTPLQAWYGRILMVKTYSFTFPLSFYALASFSLRLLISPRLPSIFPFFLSCSTYHHSIPRFYISVCPLLYILLVWCHSPPLHLPHQHNTPGRLPRLTLT